MKLNWCCCCWEWTALDGDNQRRSLYSFLSFVNYGELSGGEPTSQQWIELCCLSTNLIQKLVNLESAVAAVRRCDGHLSIHRRRDGGWWCTFRVACGLSNIHCTGWRNTHLVQSLWLFMSKIWFCWSRKSWPVVIHWRCRLKEEERAYCHLL